MNDTSPAAPGPMTIDPSIIIQSLKGKSMAILLSLSARTGLSVTIILILMCVALFIAVIAVFFMMKPKKKTGETLTVVRPDTDIPEKDDLPVDSFKELTAEKADATPSPELVQSPASQPEPAPAGLFSSIRNGLSKTRKALSSGVDKLFAGGSRLDDDMLEELEEMLITSDVGVETSMKLISSLTSKGSSISSAYSLKKAIKDEIFKLIDIPPKSLSGSTNKPHVIMIVGVNGVGKTTTIGKLASRFVKEGKKVLIVAADTFRAAASEQLTVWAERSGADIVRHKDNSDPAAVAFDGIEAALSRDVDIVMIDTAGRLHTKKNLMEELKKIKRTVSSKLPEAPHDTLMVVDATTGQNALQQAKLFNEAIGISAIALTKLDGTAKGGIVIGICHTLKIPLTYVGVGEQVEDLQDFDPKEFADALM